MDFYALGKKHAFEKYALSASDLPKIFKATKPYIAKIRRGESLLQGPNVALRHPNVIQIPKGSGLTGKRSAWRAAYLKRLNNPAVKVSPHPRTVRYKINDLEFRIRSAKDNIDYAKEFPNSARAVRRGEAAQKELSTLQKELQKLETKSRNELNTVQNELLKETMYGIPKLPPKMERWNSALTRLHELDESRYLQQIVRKNPELLKDPRAFSKLLEQKYHGLQHTRPAVLLREHNRLATLPAKQKEILTPYTREHIRSPTELKVFDQLGVPFGEGQRLSRHAIRRLEPIFKKKWRNQMKLDDL